MNRLYLENDNARITLNEDNDLLDVELFSGQTYTGLEARRLFPITGGDRYITLLNEAKEEVAIIRDLNTLMPESQKAVRHALERCYLVPKISAFTSIHEKGGKLSVSVQTDHGPCTFEVRNYSQSIKTLYDGRVLICDTNDNRYEIPDIRTIDRKSRNGLLI